MAWFGLGGKKKKKEKKNPPKGKKTNVFNVGTLEAKIKARKKAQQDALNY